MSIQIRGSIDSYVLPNYLISKTTTSHGTGQNEEVIKVLIINPWFEPGWPYPSVMTATERTLWNSFELKRARAANTYTNSLMTANFKV